MTPATALAPAPYYERFLIEDALTGAEANLEHDRDLLATEMERGNHALIHAAALVLHRNEQWVALLRAVASHVEELPERLEIPADNDHQEHLVIAVRTDPLRIIFSPDAQIKLDADHDHRTDPVLGTQPRRAKERALAALLQSLSN